MANISRLLPKLLLTGGIAAIIVWLLSRKGGVVTTLGPLQIRKMDPFPKSRKRAHAPRFIVVHHTNTRTAAKTRSVLNERELSTNYEVDQDGTIYEYVDPSVYLALHGGKTNTYSIGIDLTHYTGKSWPEVQVAAMVRLVDYLCERYKIPKIVAPDQHIADVDHVIEAGIGITRHRNWYATACPEDFPVERLGTPYRAAVA